VILDRASCILVVVQYLYRPSGIVTLSLLLLLSCSPSGSRTGGRPDAAGDTMVAVEDADGDTISDADEGRAENRDTDADGIPDYLDPDSDDDGISDAVEAGDADPSTPPEDADGDGVPNYLDLDSDDNGIPDEIEGVGDADGDGIEDFRDTDDDEDHVEDRTEILDPTSPEDFDGDGLPDFRDPDSDNDTILDGDERPPTGDAPDTDGDGIPDWQDDDSDGDGWTDQEEAGDADVRTPPVDTDGDGIPDFRDPDSDNDGVSDADELGFGTSRTRSDTDGDGVSDLIETGAGTDPLDSLDNPRARGDFVFTVPYEADPDPLHDDLAFSTVLRKVDVYIIVDRSGSMTAEIGSVRDNIQTALSNLTCPPLGTGAVGDCIEDLWAGMGSVGYTGGGGQSYRNHLDVQPNPALVGPSLPTSEPTGCCAEPLHYGVAFASTGTAPSGCSVSDPPPARTDCSTSPAAMMGFGGTGYPCFRDGALPVILLATDEPPTATYNCPNTADTIAAMTSIGAKMIGILGSGVSATVRTDLAALATGTGSIDSTTGMGLVFNGADAAAASAIEMGIRTLASAVRVDISAVPVDDPSDAVDAVDAFLSRLETLQLGTPECTSGLTDADTNGDGFPDTYISVLFGTPVCWRVIPKTNVTVMPTAAPQVFRANIEVYGDGVTLLDERTVFFLVPPVIPMPGGPD
jgi:hypothetical protein